MTARKTTTRRKLSKQKPKAKARGGKSRPKVEASERPRRVRMIRAIYDAAQTTDENRKHWANIDSLSSREANSLSVRKELRERARYEVANNSYAKGIVLTLANQLVGSGPRLQVTTPDATLNREIERAFSVWAAAVRLADCLRTLKQAKTTDGEAIAVLALNEMLPTAVKLDLRLVECDQLTTPLSQVTIDPRWVDGIQFDEFDNPITYDVLKAHPGDALWNNDYDRLPSRRVIHWFRADRPGQVRGIPELTPALPLFAQLRRFTIATLTAAETAAMFTALLESTAPPDETEVTEEDDFASLEIVRNMMTQLPRNMKLSQLKAEHPAQSFEMFVKVLLREIARCLNVPWHIAAGDYSDSNYASSRLGSQDFRLAVKVERQDCEAEVLDRVVEAWFDEAVLIPGLLPDSAQAFAAGLPHVWHWQPWDYIDPLTEAQADTARLENGTTSLIKLASERGENWQEWVRDQVEVESYRQQVAAQLGQPEPTEQTRPVAAIQATATSPRLLIASGAPIEIKALADNPKLPRFQMVAYTGVAMKLPGFAHPVVVDLAGLHIPRQRIPIYRDHRDWKLIGHSEEIRNSGTELTIAGVISGTGQYAREVRDNAKNLFPWQASIGADANQVEFFERGQTVEVNGRSFAGPVYVARRTTLRETSFVPNGADGNTTASVAAKESAMTFEQWLLGFMTLEEVQALGDAEKSALQKAFDHSQGGDEEAEPEESPMADMPAEAPVPTATAATATPATITATVPVAKPVFDKEAARREAAAEEDRIASIRKLCAANPTQEIKANGHPVNLAAHAIREGWTAKDVELHMLREERRSGPHGFVKSSDPTLEALQCAMILRAGGRLDHPAYQSQAAIALKIPQALRLGINAEHRQRAMEAGHRFSSMSLPDICAMACRLDGKTVPHDRFEMIRAAFSGSALNDIFTTNVNAVLLASYMEEGDSTQGWTSSVDVANFQTQERPRVQVGPGLSIHPRGATADHAEFSDVVESYKIHRFSKQFVVDEQDIVDDAMNALSDTPQRLGQAAAWLRPDLVYYILLANASLDATSTALFHADQDQGTGEGNLDTSSALSSTTLKVGVGRMSLFQENSRNLNIRATHLIVPPTLLWTARELVESAEMDFGGDDETSRGTKNVLQGILQVASDARLENGVTDPITSSAGTGSAANWFLASSAAHTIEVAYLRGTGRAPQVRSFNLEQGQFGIGWDVKLDIGAKALDWRGLYQGQG